MSPRGALTCLWWAVQAVALVLSSKWVYSTALFDYPYSIIAIQCGLVGAMLLLLAALRGEVPAQNNSQLNSSQSLLWPQAAAFADVFVPTLLFVLYQYTNARALRFISLPAFTVVKSLAPLGVTTVERAAFGGSVPSGVYSAMALAVLANVLTFDSAATLSHLSMRGYAWSLLNLMTHIFYVLSLRYCSDAYPTTGKALHVNLLTLCLVLPLARLNQEPTHFLHHVLALPATDRVPLALCCALSAGCAVSVLSAFEAASSDGLRYLAVLNKIAIVLLGAYIFRTQFSPVAWFGVSLAVASGFLFVYSKSKSQSSLGIPRPIVSSPTLELLLPTGQDGEVSAEKLTAKDDIFKQALIIA